MDNKKKNKLFMIAYLGLALTYSVLFYIKYKNNQIIK